MAAEEGRARDLGGRCRRPASTASTPTACATPTAWRGSRRPRQLWTVVNERDELGSDIVPDYLTAVRFRRLLRLAVVLLGRLYRQARRRARRHAAAICRAARIMRSGPHTASLGLAFAGGAKLGPRFADGAFIGQHGSWNRKPQGGLQGDLRAVRQGPAGGQAGGRADRLPRQGRGGARPAGGRRDRPYRRVAGGGRCRQQGVAGDAG